jgi:predicted O-methyltransferase YrrM
MPRGDGLWKDRRREAGLTVLCVLAFTAAVTFAVLWIQYRRRLYAALGRELRAAVRTGTLAELDPVFEPGSFGPTTAAEVQLVPGGPGVPGGTSDREAWILAALALTRRTIFEFGTATGRTTYLLARNSPPDARVYTLTLPPDRLPDYRHEAGDAAAATRAAHAESRFASFFYEGTAVEDKVEQLFGDSKALDVTPWEGRCDLIFIDGSHAYSYVMSDTAKAMAMLAPGGVIIWHDYRPERRSTRDVRRALDELRNRYPLFRLPATSMVAYRRPAG